jgi:hypothetical protein
MSPLAIRLAALVAAVAMVVGAIVVRNKLNEDEVTAHTELKLLCATELEATCDEIAKGADAKITVTVEDAGATLDRLADAPQAGVDGWLTPGPFPEMVEALRKGQAQLAPLFEKTSGSLARSPGVFAGWKERVARMQKACEGGVVGWKCLGLASGQPWTSVGGEPAWGAVTTSIPDPTTSAAGLVTLGAATADFFGRTDLSTADLEDDTFSTWLAQLSGNNSAVDVSTMLAAGPSVVSFVGDLEQAVKPAVEGASADRRDQVSVIYPAPMGNADVVLGMAEGERSARLLTALQSDRARDAFRAAGYGPPASGPSGLPPADLLIVLREQWGA